MCLKFLQKYGVLLFALLLSLVVVVMFFMPKTEKPLTKESPKIKELPKIKESITEPKVPVLPKPKAQAVKETAPEVPLTTPIEKKKIDILETEEPSSYQKLPREIDKIMLEQKKLDNFEKEKQPTAKKKGEKIEYEIDLEEGAAEKLKAGEPLEPEMVKGKINFSKSF